MAKRQAHKEVTIICKAKVIGDVQDGPEFVAITLDKLAYRTKCLIAESMRSLSLDVPEGYEPYKTEFFYYGVKFLNPCGHNVLNKEEAASLVFEDKDTKAEWLGGFEDPRVEGADSTLEELADINNSVDVPLLGVKKDGVIVTCCIKHTDTEVQTDTVRTSVLAKVAKMLNYPKCMDD